MCPAYDKEQGYELAGFAWFQGWNDMVDRGTYPDRDKPGGYDRYTECMAHFIRDIRKDLAAPGLPYGFNFQTLSPVTGPGYFVAQPSPERPEVLIDYTKVPDANPPGWPDVRSNERGLSRFVYGFMVDTLRRVSEHVTIGSAARQGKDLGSWFLLCRESG